MRQRHNFIVKQSSGIGQRLPNILVFKLRVLPLQLGAVSVKRECLKHPAHIVTSSVTVRGLVNMSAVAVYDAQVSAASSPAPRG